ncbi:outer membrane protein [Primorskyibacter marinus]|uniref:outer membrane protein n=1 Tax=Primorskyibacter marinus TaxID=1977320 RepID=UPI000E303B62|nr:outer membrane beta-barrel protein [Primorskyibacter marinus]
MSASRLTLAAALAASTAIAAPAFAGSLDNTLNEPEPVAPVAVAAPAPLYDWTGPSVGAQLGFGDIETEDAGGAEGDGGLYGLRAYYDYDFGNYVVGGGIQYDESDIDIDGAATLDKVFRAGLRAGVDLNRTFLYGTGGYAKAFTEDDAVSLGDSNGYFVGLGAEHFLTEKVTVGGEILYHQFDDFDISDVEANATTANVSVNYRF